MTYEERQREAAKYVRDFLSSYTPPRGLDPTQLATRIKQVADAFARRMPTTGDYQEVCESVLDRIRDTHMSNTWPSQAVFVMAMPESEKMQPRAAQTFRPDEWELNAQKMADGQPVAERYVWGSTSDALVSKRLVTRECRDRYRKFSVKQFQRTYGRHAQEVMAGRIGADVHAYFATAAE